MDKNELIDGMREAHEEMAGTIARIGDDRLIEPAMGDWTAKDLVAHMAWWHHHSAMVVERLRMGQTPYERDDPAFALDARNERTHREHLNDPPGQVRRDFEESFGRLLAALQPVSEEELFAADRFSWLGDEALVETILWDTSRHYDEHRKVLEQMAAS